MAKSPLQPLTGHQFSHTFTNTDTLGYYLALPPDYENNPDQHYPLMLFLHGAGERTDHPAGLDAVFIHGPLKRLHAGKTLPFIIIAPQCTANTWWSSHSDALFALLDDVEKKYRVDSRRVYLTGLSMGGFGTWHLSTLQPQRFAAVAPICGGMPWFVSPESAAESLKNTPLWVFHGAKDEVVGLHESQRMVDALKAVKANVKFTIYPSAGHDSWTKTYANPKFYEWLLQHQLPARE